MKKILIPILMILMLSLVSATDDYTQTGTTDNNYKTDVGFFNEELTTFTTTSKIISDPKQTPLVADLDGDGTNEIIVLDGATFNLYHGKDLTTVDGFTSSNISGTAHFITYDIDADGNTEIISIDGGSGALEIIEYNGTSIHIKQSYNVGENHTDGEVMVQCRAQNQCIVVYIKDDLCTGVGCTTELNARYFGVSSLFDEVTIGTSNRNSEASISKSTLCFPKIRHISVGNYDGDADTDFIFSYVDVVIKNPEVDDDVLIVYLDGVSLPSVVRSLEETATHDFSNLIQNGCSTGGYGERFTAPLVADMDAKASNGLETIIGFQVNDDDFIMRSFDKASGTERFPSITNAEGNIISNVMRFNAFDNSANLDFCVLGIVNDADFSGPCDTGSDCLDLFCGSLENNLPFSTLDNIQYAFQLDGIYNLTSGYDNWNTVGHSIQHKTGDVPQIDELLSAYGVFDLDFSSCDTLGFCEMDRIFNTPIDNSTVIAVDVEQVGRDDLLILSTTNIHYIDDDFSNSAGEISSYSINPCLDSTWKQNTTVSVQIEVTDVDGDNVNANSILYFGESEPQTATSINASSGTTFSFTFIANQTIGSSTLRLQGRDLENFQTNDTIDLSFSVGTNGLEFGDCITTVDVVTTTEAEEESDIPTTEADNTIVRGVNTINDTFNLGLGGNIIWIIIMIVIAMTIWVTGTGDGSHKIGVVVIVEILALIVGSLLGFISTGIIITISVVSIIGIAFWLRNMFSGQ